MRRMMVVAVALVLSCDDGPSDDGAEGGEYIPSQESRADSCVDGFDCVADVCGEHQERSEAACAKPVEDVDACVELSGIWAECFSQCRLASEYDYAPCREQGADAARDCLENGWNTPNCEAAQADCDAGACM